NAGIGNWWPGLHGQSEARAGKVTGVISATRGNHGQSIAFAASRAGIPATIYDIPAGQNHSDPLSAHVSTLLHEPGERGGAGAFRDIMCVLEIGAHRFSDIVFAELQDARRAAPSDCQWLFPRIARR